MEHKGIYVKPATTDELIDSLRNHTNMFVDSVEKCDISSVADATSKCSFLGNESIGHHDVYMGKRIYRGLFKCSKGIDISAYIGCNKQKVIDTINADVQGAYNGLRNVDPRFSVLDIMEGVV